MAFTREEIIQKAKQLEASGAPSSKIKDFVSLASKDLQEETDSSIKQETSLLKKGFDAFTAFPRLATGIIKEGARELGRAGARPAVQFTRGVQGLVPGGKTGKEDIDVPFLGKFEGTETGLPTIGESAKEAGEVLLAGKGEAIAKQVIKPFKALRTLIKDKTALKELDKLEDLISPKLTSKEQQIAQAEGRVIRGEERLGGLAGKTPDVVVQSEKVKKAANTIQSEIPNASNLDDAVLNTKLNTKVESISKQLQPNLKKVETNKDQLKLIREEWENIKELQSKQPEFVAFKGAKQSQNNFETFLNELTKPVKGEAGQFRVKNLDDLWNVRKKYDDSIKKNVKEATELASPQLQLQKEMWLENRRVLNNVIKELSEGLDLTAKESFDKMSDMYLARQNIIGKTKLDLEGSTGLFTKKNLIKLLGGAAVGKYLID